MHSVTFRRLGIVLFIIGVLGAALSVYYGMIRFYLVVIVPVFTSDNTIGALPLLAIFAGIVMMAIGPVFGNDYPDAKEGMVTENVDSRQDQGRVKIGGVGLIGPIPIVFGSDKKMALTAAAIAIVVLAIVILILL